LEAGLSEHPPERLFQIKDAVVVIIGLSRRASGASGSPGGLLFSVKNAVSCYHVIKQARLQKPKFPEGNSQNPAPAKRPC